MRNGSSTASGSLMTTLTIVLVLDEPGSHVLLTWRHHFIVGKWVWELPGGYVDDDEDGAAAAVRETEEETGWRPRGVSFVLSYQPMIGHADFPQDLYLARGADLVRDPAAIVAALARQLAPGSFVVISHLTGDFVPGPVLAGVEAYNRLVPTTLVPRTHTQVSALFAALPMVPTRGGPTHRVAARPRRAVPVSADMYAGIAHTATSRRRMTT
jgi:8-oxo-dGTP pyrophosphatase MutT (NUDIX family)